MFHVFFCTWFLPFFSRILVNIWNSKQNMFFIFKIICSFNVKKRSKLWEMMLFSLTTTKLSHHRILEAKFSPNLWTTYSNARFKNKETVGQPLTNHSVNWTLYERNVYRLQGFLGSLIFLLLLKVFYVSEELVFSGNSPICSAVNTLNVYLAILMT